MRWNSMLFILFPAAAISGLPAPPESSASAMPVITMELSRSGHGDWVVSVAELETDTNVPKEARDLYEEALKADRKGDHVRALERAKAAVELAPTYFQAHASLAVAYVRTGDVDEADRELNIAASLNPHYLPAREIQGLVYFWRGDFREAAVTLEALVRLAPSRETARYFLIQALLKLGDVQRARYHAEIAKVLRREKRWRGFEVPEFAPARRAEAASFAKGPGRPTLVPTRPLGADVP